MFSSQKKLKIEFFGYTLTQRNKIFWSNCRFEFFICVGHDLNNFKLFIYIFDSFFFFRTHVYLKFQKNVLGWCIPFTFLQPG